MTAADQNQSPTVSTIQVLALLKATGDLTGVTPQDLVAYAHGWLRYEDAVEDVPIEVEAQLDHADLDLVGLFGAASASERIGLALELLEGIGPEDIDTERMRWLVGARVGLRCVKSALESLPQEARP